MPKFLPALLIGLGVAFVFGLLFGSLGLGSLGTGVAVMLGVFAGYIAANLQGTRAGPKASDAQRAAALSLRPSPGKAMIVVWREGVVGMAAGLNVSLDGRPFAQLKSPQFTAVEVEPGAHGLGFAFGGLAASQNRTVVVGADLGEGEVAVFRATLKMGALTNSIMVDREEAVPAVSDRLSRMKMVAPAAPAPA